MKLHRPPTLYFVKGGWTRLIAADTDEAVRNKNLTGGFVLLPQSEVGSDTLLMNCVSVGTGYSFLLFKRARLFDCKLAASSAVCIVCLKTEWIQISAAAQAWAGSVTTGPRLSARLHEEPHNDKILPQTHKSHVKNMCFKIEKLSNFD